MYQDSLVVLEQVLPSFQSSFYLIPADKLGNIYNLENDQHQKLLRENFTKTYKKSNFNKVRNINNKAKKITEKLPVADKFDKLQEKEAYIMIKDLKGGFPNRISCRSINLYKSSIGKISKGILDRIHTAARNHTKVNQWKDTSSVSDWFKNVADYGIRHRKLLPINQ